MNYTIKKIRNDLIHELVNDLINLNKKYKFSKIYLEDNYFEIHYNNLVYELILIEENNVVLLCLQHNKKIIYKMPYMFEYRRTNLDKILNIITRRKK